MKTLKIGNAQEWWVGKIGTCKHCNTEVQLEAGDKVNAQFDRNEALASVKCPTCKNDIWVYPGSPGATDHDCAWKERARKHGCDVDNGDADCG